MICGRGGTGRRAALRSLWGKTRGSSSLLDRTILRPAGLIRGSARQASSFPERRRTVRDTLALGATQDKP